MKNLFILSIFITAAAAAQPIVQPLSSGDYWRLEEYNRKLREFANTRTLDPSVNVQFPASSISFGNMKATRLTGENEIAWEARSVTNGARLFVEYSRNKEDFERAGEVYLQRAEDGNRYVFRHPFNDSRLVYYRVAVINSRGRVVAYSPIVQLSDAEFSTRIFPTVIKGSTFHVQAAEPYELLQVVASDSKVVFQKPLDKVTGTINIGLPILPSGIYFVRLTSADRPQFVQKVFVE